MSRKPKTVPFSVLHVAHPTIIGAIIPLKRIIGTPQEEAKVAQIGKKSEESAARLRKALSEEISKNQTQS